MCLPRGRPISAPCPAGSVFPRVMRMPQTAADAGDILDLQGDEFARAAQRAGEAEQGGADGRVGRGGKHRAGGDQLAQHVERQQRRPSRPGRPVQAQREGLQRRLDVTMPRGSRPGR